MDNVTTTTPEGGESSTSGMMMYGIRAAYNFQLKNSPAILPFVALDVVAAALSENINGENIVFGGIGYGAAGGVRYFVSRQASVNAELDYNVFSLSGTVQGTDVTVDESSFGVLLGLSVFFGGAK